MGLIETSQVAGRYDENGNEVSYDERKEKTLEDAKAARKQTVKNIKNAAKDVKNSIKSAPKKIYKSLKGGVQDIGLGVMSFVANPFSIFASSSSGSSQVDSAASSPASGGGLGGELFGMVKQAGMSYIGGMAAGKGMKETSKDDGDKAKSDKVKAPPATFVAVGSKGTETHVLNFEISGITMKVQNISKLQLKSGFVRVPEGGVSDSCNILYDNNVEYEPITITCKLDDKDTRLFNWYSDSTASSWPERKSCALILKPLNSTKEVRRWNIFGAIPIGWSVETREEGNQLPNSKLESITIAYERIEPEK